MPNSVLPVISDAVTTESSKSQKPSSPRQATSTKLLKKSKDDSVTTELSKSQKPSSPRPATSTKLLKKSKAVDDGIGSFIEGRGSKELGVSNVKKGALTAAASLMKRIGKLEIAMHFTQVVNEIKSINIGWPKEWSNFKLFQLLSLDLSLFFPQKEGYYRLLWTLSPFIL